MKGNLLQGTARGRMGEIVASVRHGKQLFSKYQPNINNPKSPKQMNQRERFSRASKFAKTFVGDGIYSNTYATIKNSSRSLYVNIVQLTIIQGFVALYVYIERMINNEEKSSFYLRS